MKVKIFVALLVLIPFLVSSIAFAEQPLPLPEGGLIIEPGSYELKTDSDPNQMISGPDSSYTDIAVQYPNWVPRKLNQFKTVKYTRGGAKFKAAAPGEYQVVITIPIMPYFDGTKQNLKYVEFCAKAPNPSKARPISWYIFEQNPTTPPAGGTFTWTSTDYHCVYYNVPVVLWMRVLTIEVGLKFKNTSDYILMWKAWAAVH